MLSFFPLDVLDEIWDLLSQFLRDFLPTLINVKIVGILIFIDRKNCSLSLSEPKRLHFLIFPYL